MMSLQKNRLKEIMIRHITSGAVPGMVYLVSRGGELEVEALGLKAFDRSDPMQRDTLFRISSMTKPLTAAAAMILVEECRIRLDDPIDRFLPELADRQVLRTPGSELDDTVPANRWLTVRDLLTLRMGIGHIMDAGGPYPIQQALKEAGLLQGPPKPEDFPGPDEWISRVAKLPLIHQPGEKWMYDLGLDILGVLIERASGQSFPTFLQERICGPLGMNDTAFSVPADKADRLPTSYIPNFGTGETEVFDDAGGGDWNKPPLFAAGSSGLVSTADDYLAFAEMLLRQGMHHGKKILSRASVELMTSNQLSERQMEDAEMFLGDGNGWGFGMSVAVRRTNIWSVPGRFGWDGGLGTSWASDPKEGVTGILLTQNAWMSPTPPEVWSDFWTGVYQSLD